MIKDRKELLEEVLNEINKNQISREIELDLVDNYHMPKALKIKNKEDRKVHVESLQNKKRELTDEMEARKYIIKSVKNKLK